MKFEFSLDLEKLAAALGAIADDVRAEVPAAGQAWGEKVLGVAQDIAPIESGTLRESGAVEVASSDEGATVAIGFGGAASAYAKVQHENVALHHDVGQAKFLKTAAAGLAPDVPTDIGNAIAERIRNRSR
jgi:hypothetical protein